MAKEKIWVCTVRLANGAVRIEKWFTEEDMAAFVIHALNCGCESVDVRIIVDNVLHHR